MTFIEVKVTYSLMSKVQIVEINDRFLKKYIKMEVRVSCGKMFLVSFSLHLFVGVCVSVRVCVCAWV